MSKRTKVNAMSESEALQQAREGLARIYGVKTAKAPNHVWTIPRFVKTTFCILQNVLVLALFIGIVFVLVLAGPSAIFPLLIIGFVVVGHGQ